MVRRIVILGFLFTYSLFGFQVPGNPNCVLPYYEELITTEYEKIDIMNMVTHARVQTIKATYKSSMTDEDKKAVECKYILDKYSKYIVDKKDLEGID